MKSKYQVIQIREADFGCEELPDGAEVMVEVTLKAADGTTCNLLHSDALLYERSINVGDEVFLVEGKLEKVND